MDEYRPVQNSAVPAVETPILCPQCHQIVRLTDYFCANCGKSLRTKPVSLSFLSFVLYTLASIVLPPMGIIWGIRYIKDGESTTKYAGIFFIVLTIVLLVLLAVSTIQVVNQVNTQVNSQLQNFVGGY